MDFNLALAACSLGLMAGALIGCVGIGGVILVPALALLAGVPLQTAVPAANAAYLVSGIAGTIAYARSGAVPWGMALPLTLAAMPAAWLGALASGAAPPAAVEGAIALLTASSGAYALLGRNRLSEGDRGLPSLLQLLLIGAVTGFLSALTGTGGPMVLVPLLLWLKSPIVPTIAVSQLIQLPIAVLATGANLSANGIDGKLAGALAIGLAVGTWVGARYAQAAPRALLEKLVAGTLVVTGAVMSVRALSHWG